MPGPQKSMNELACDIRNGSEQAFHLFFTRMYRRVVLYLNQKLFDNSFSEDIAQEAFIKVWENRHRIDPDQSLEAWLFTIVRNTAITHIQKTLAERSRLKKSHEWDILYTDGNPGPVVSNEGVFNLQYKDSLVSYHKALKTISPERLHCFRLHREKGLTYHQIAQSEGLSVKTVEKYISFVIRSLREILPHPNAFLVILHISCLSFPVS